MDLRDDEPGPSQLYQRCHGFEEEEVGPSQAAPVGGKDVVEYHVHYRVCDDRFLYLYLQILSNFEIFGYDL